ncbi:MAG: hypothetical protein E7538_06125 [Ruminococcaceae bacterium]|nr:hypothetical protein [Oscillospiraceae bacterium]
MKKLYRMSIPAAVVLLLLLFSFVAFAADGKVTLEAANSAEGIHLQWNECKGAYYYEVYRQTGKKGEKLLLSKVQTTSYEDRDTVSGKTYSYTVVPAFADYTVAKESDAVSVYCISAVRISKAESQRNGITLEWKAVKNAKGYRLYRKSAEEEQWSTVAKLGADVRSFTDAEISPAHKYTYCVKAFSGEYESASVNQKQLSYIDYPVVKGIKNTADGIHLSWKEVSDISYYIVYRKVGEQAYKAYALLDSSYTEYEDKSPASGQICSYYVCAADADGNKSGYDRALSERHVKKSVITAAVNTVKGIKLYWSKSEGCQGYGIFRKAPGEKEWKLRGTVYGENSLSAVDSKVKNGNIYIYTVRAFKGRTLAAYNSDGDALRFYSAPEKLKSSASEKKGYVISWDEVEGVNSYAVYRKQGDGSWNFLGFTTRSYYTDNSVKSKQKYTYGVEAYEGSILKSGMAEIAIK